MSNDSVSSNAPQALASYDEAALNAAFRKLSEEVQADAARLGGPEAVEAFRLHWLGRKAGRLKLVSELWLKAAPAEARKLLGLRFNRLKQEIEAALEAPIAAPSAAMRRGAAIDLSLPSVVRRPGTPHPLLETMHAVVKVFENLGYSVNLGPQVETDFYNFEALNFPPNHPARDTQDTLLVAGQQGKAARDRLLMRTHTSPIFHQIEGLAVGPDITFSDLKGTLDHAMKAMFGADVRTRFFPSFFPFTEPSADVQISCIFCGGTGCRRCKHSGWIELLGCGMVDPAVFAAVTDERRRQGRDPEAYDPRRVSGFAFGMGVERIAMIRHGVADIGQFYSGDMRFLEQFA